MSETMKNTNALQTPAEQSFPMKVDVKLRSIRQEGNVKAFLSVTLNGCFVIRNVKLVEGPRGLFMAMPCYKTANGRYQDICFPNVRAFREQLSEAVIDAYYQALSKSKRQGDEYDPLQIQEQA